MPYTYITPAQHQNILNYQRLTNLHGLQNLASINTGTQIFNSSDCTMIQDGVKVNNPNCTPGSATTAPTVTTHTSDISTSGTSSNTQSGSGSSTITTSSSTSTSTGTGDFGDAICKADEKYNTETGECNGAMIMKAASAMLLACYVAMF